MTSQTGFIGLGTMGLPMAKCLRSTGMEVLGWDLDSTAMSGFEPLSAPPASGQTTEFGELAETADGGLDFSSIYRSIR